MDVSDGLMRRNVKALINPNSKENWNSKVETGGLIAMAIETHRKFHRGSSVCEEDNFCRPPKGASNGRIEKRKNGATRNIHRYRHSITDLKASMTEPETFSNLVNMSRRVSVPTDFNIYYNDPEIDA